MQASELKKSIDIDGLSLEGDDALVIWQWEWTDTNDVESDEESTTSITIIPDTPPPVSDSEEDDCDPAFSIGYSPVVTHTATFKCIGCTKDTSYQEILARISQLRNRHEEVACKLVPEPDNPCDSRAIAFKCNVGGKWHTIGYVVREALNEVHEAISARTITTVSIDWVKYIIYWQSPGWYAGIKVTRIGEWSRSVLLSQSAKM